ncbi:hypothetical protein OG288_15835 [Streptomyces tauricus]|uniref:Phage head-tail adapter protein n=1 Tax=Streptomyces tauricus TaxID=68274 RepID=A0ABZ1JHG6_9ACTN|nr:hypothetical protein [Streptomyces tauricus]
MNVLPTTRITVYRGTSTDDWGDESDNYSVHASGVPANMRIKQVKASTESSTLPQQMTTAVCRVRSNRDFNSNDIVLDEKTGDSWQVVSVEKPQHPGKRLDIRLNLLRVE